MKGNQTKDLQDWVNNASCLITGDIDSIISKMFLKVK